MLEFGGRLGHCKQAQRKGRFILLGVSQEGIKWKVPWSSHLVPGHPWEGGIPLGGRDLVRGRRVARPVITATAAG